MNSISDMDLSKLPLKHSEVGEFIPIEIYEKDVTLRKQKYPYVTHIKIEKYIYTQPNGLDVTKTITTKKVKGKKSVIDRRYNMKPFGQAAISNDGVTTLGAEVFIEKPNILSKNNFKLNRECRNKNKKNISFSTGMKIFKPSKKNIEKFKNLKTFENNDSNTGFMKNTFIPSKLKNKMEENKNLDKFTIVIKNIPSDYNVKDVEFRLKKMFSSYGEIERLKVLTNKNDRTLTRDIAFIDFVYPSDANKLLKSDERFKIDFSILGIEKSKKK